MKTTRTAGIEDLLASDTFCPDPWTELSTWVDGRWSVCCNARPFDYGITDRLPTAHYNGPEMRALRSAMLAGDKEALGTTCGKCHGKEALGARSRRLNQIEVFRQRRGHVERLGELVAATAHDGTVAPAFLSRIDIKVYGNFCNLRCYMCYPACSSSIGLERKRQGELPASQPHLSVPIDALRGADRERFVDDLLVLIERAQEIYFSGGEPLINRFHYDLLDAIAARGLGDRLRLTYNSNMTKLPVVRGRSVHDYFAAFRRVHIGVSTDGVGLRNDYIRYGSSWPRLLENLRALRERSPHVTVSMNTTVSILSVLDIVELHREITGRIGLPHRHTNVLMTPTHLRAYHLPDPLKERIADELATAPPALRHILDFLGQDRDEAEFQRFAGYLRGLDRARGT
ncbi:MAG TPA: twitch domain-containing radical SAM protein, partial [Arenibaculum sp.]|nr:twitch domain-containing radical SAM protein [Arenibaculum sp.]